MPEPYPENFRHSFEDHVTSALQMGREAINALPDGGLVDLNFFSILLLKQRDAFSGLQIEVGSESYRRIGTLMRYRLGRELLPHVVDVQEISVDSPLPANVPVTIKGNSLTTLLTLASTVVKQANTHAQAGNYTQTTQSLSQEIIDAYRTEHKSLFDYDTLRLLHLDNCTTLADPDNPFTCDILPQPNRTLVDIEFGSEQKRDGGSIIIDPLFEQPGQSPQLGIVRVGYLQTDNYCQLNYGSPGQCVRSTERLKPNSASSSFFTN